MNFYKSCPNIHNSFNFYRSGKILACCEKIHPSLEIANITDDNLPHKIIHNQKELIKAHKNSNAPEICQKCKSFQADHWDDSLSFSRIVLNHYKTCNLKCSHCGYRKFDNEENDTPHELVFETIQRCISAGICSPKPFLEIGGGEPSLAKGIEKIIDHAISQNWRGLVNSNGARFSEVFAKAVNQQLFTLLLTPDAGSKKTYTLIKGVDNFDATWRNIGRYMAKTNGQALVKFILEEGNKDDIPAMIETSARYGVKTLVLSMDMNIKKDQYSEYITLAKRFISLAHKNSLNIIKGAFLPAF